MKVKGYATYDKLKTCMVGRTYNKEQFKDIKNQKVKDVLFRILDETEEDYQNLCDVLNKAGVETLRPDIVNGDLSHRPANQPRDDMAVIGDTLYVNNNRPEYKSILRQYRQQSYCRRMRTEKASQHKFHTQARIRPTLGDQSSHVERQRVGKEI